MFCRVTLDRYLKQHPVEDKHNDYLPQSQPELPGIADTNSKEYLILSQVYDHFKKELKIQ
jgi:hypothetical protein